ncbi:MAG: hypothetical protein H8E90_05450 [Anaerolineales bacterium]|nr:hypothetical protein [Anaerolineales bacterium]
MVRPLWRLLLEDPSNLTCGECFAVMDYYAELLAKGSADLLPEVIRHLKECPHCEAQHREELRHLIVSQSETSTASLSDLTASDQ